MSRLEKQERREAIAERLAAEIERAGVPRQFVADTAGVDVKTLAKWLSAKSDVDASGLMLLSERFGFSATAVLTGASEPAPAPVRSGAAERSARSTTREVPIFDIRVSAGPGRELLGEEPIDHMSFPLDMLRSLGNPATMALLQLDGDSMWPELRGGQLVMIDVSQREPREGIVVARLDQQLVCKRLRLTGPGIAELVSTNTAYPPLQVEFDGERFEVIGRAVWSGGRLS